MTKGEIIFSAGVVIVILAVFFIIALNIVYAVQKRRLHSLIQEDYI